MSTAAPEQVEAGTRQGFAGQSVPRKEDGRLLKGQGMFTDDAWQHRMGYAHFARSPHAHARIVSIDTMCPWATELRRITA